MRKGPTQRNRRELKLLEEEDGEPFYGCGNLSVFGKKWRLGQARPRGMNDEAANGKGFQKQREKKKK